MEPSLTTVDVVAYGSLGLAVIMLLAMRTLPALGNWSFRGFAFFSVLSTTLLSVINEGSGAKIAFLVISAILATIFYFLARFFGGFDRSDEMARVTSNAYLLIGAVIVAGGAVANLVT